MNFSIFQMVYTISGGRKLVIKDRTPVQVRRTRQAAQGWCTGMALRGGMGREGQDGEHVYTQGWVMWMYGKNHHSIVK